MHQILCIRLEDVTAARARLMCANSPEYLRGVHEMALAMMDAAEENRHQAVLQAMLSGAYTDAEHRAAAYRLADDLAEEPERFDEATGPMEERP